MSAFSLLVADDDPAHVLAIRQALDGAAAAVELRAVRTLSELRAAAAAARPDLVIIDFVLPDGCALDILPETAALFPVLVMTGQGNEGTAVAAMKAGALDYIVKSPEAFAEIPHTLARARREWNLRLEHWRSEALALVERDLGLALSQASTLDAFLEHCLTSALEASALDSGSVYLVNDDLSLDLAVHRGLSDEFVQATRHYEPDSQNARLVLGGQPLYVADESTGLAFDNLRGREGLNAAALLPIFDRGRAVACLNVATHGRGVIPHYARLALESIASRLGPAIVRARAEAALRESERQFRNLVSSLDAIVYHVAVDGGDLLHARITYVNPQIEGILGWAPRDLASDPGLWARLIHPDDQDEVFRSTLSLRRSERPLRRSYRMRRRDADEYRWLEDRVVAVRDAQGRIVALHGLAHDVTEIRRAEDALRESEARLRKAQRVASLGHYSFDATTGLWTSSEMLDEIFGIGESYPRSIEGWLGIIHPEDRALMQAYLEQHVVHDGGPFDREYRIVRVSDQAERWVHGLGDLALDEAGRTIRMFGVIQDVTERKAAEAERLDLERRLLHAQKLESLGVLAGGIAHDFNNLLMGVLGSLDLVAHDPAATTEVRLGVERAMLAARRAADLTRQMLAYSGKGRFVRARVDLADLVRENAELLRATVRPLVVFGLRLSGEPTLIEADPGQVQQVVMNLITNAAEAVGAMGGAITLTTGVVTCAAGDLARSRLETKPAPGRFAFVDVADTGCGMPPETQERLFDPFFTTKFTGRGLGMSAVLGIVRAHDGAILIDSAPGEGSTIRVLFPACDPQTAVEDAPAPTDPRPAAKRASGLVLVVDDEQAVRAPCREFIERLGYQGLEAADGPGALALFDQRTSEIRLVILDLTMPGMSGAEVLREMRRRRPDLPVLVSSGFGEEAAREELGNEGWVAFIQKPYRLSSLAEKIAQTLEGDAP